MAHHNLRVTEASNFASAGNIAPLPHAARRLVLLGASTGSTDALQKILPRLPSDFPPIAIVQHIPALFSRALAQRLDSQCRIAVREAADGDRLLPGLALIAPGNHHLLVDCDSGGYCVRVVGGPHIWHQRPAVDILFRSAAERAGPHVIAGLLTGMGRDGADGLRRLREKGALTFAQDEASSAVYGMPRAAWETGAARHRIPLESIAAHLISCAGTVPAVHPFSPATSSPALSAHAHG